MYNLSFIGDLTVDVYPKLKQLNLGGSSLTSALWAKKLKAEVSVLGAVGDDEAGKEYFQLFKQDHINSKYIKVIHGHTSKIEIFVDQKGEHTYGEWQPGVYEKYHLEKNDFTFLKTQDAVVLPVYHKTRHLLDELVRHSGLTTDQRPILVVDFDDLSQFDKKTSIIEKYLPYIDIVKLGLDIDRDKDLIQKLKKISRDLHPQHPPSLLTPPIFVITLAQNGSLSFAGQKTYRQKTRKLKITNSTGAGDAYISGFLVEYLKSKNIATSLKSGTMAASVFLKEVV